MIAGAVQISSELPSSCGPDVTIRFFPEYSSKHPLWFWFGYPDLADLQLPTDLIDRLHRWSSYWDSTFHWDDGWPAGAPETWWMQEEAHLPRDVAIAFGTDFVIEVDNRYLHSTTGPEFPAAAAALHTLIDAEVTERRQIQANTAEGGRYDLIAGGISYTKWLAQREQNDHSWP